MKKFIFYMIFIYSGVAHGKTFLLGKIGPNEIEFDLDAYYTSLGVTISLTNDPIPVIPLSHEDDIYNHLMDNIFSPRFLVLEYSINPMPILGIYSKKHHQKLFDKASISPDLNLIKVVTSGFNEPHAFTLFLTSMTDFSKRSDSGKPSRGYSGYLFTYGDYHIYNNSLIRDHWIESEIKLKGSTYTKDRSMSWSFRAGGKFHSNPDIRDSFYLSLNRDRVDHGDVQWSIFKNSNGALRVDVDAETGALAKVMTTVGKAYPLGDKKVFTISIGVIKEYYSNYRGDLAELKPDSEWSFLFRPNLSF